jgi:hypothetical protein
MTLAADLDLGSRLLAVVDVSVQKESISNGRRWRIYMKM